MVALPRVVLVMQPSLLLLLLVLAPLLLHSPVSAQTTPMLRFFPQTSRAAWSPRWDSNLEWYPHALTFTPVNSQGVAGTPITWTGRVMIVQGNGQNPRTNDIWASGNLGITWYLIAGRTTNVSAAGTRATTSFTEVLSHTATGVDHHQRIYRVGGSDASNNLYNSVWLSRDGGLTWTNQAVSQGRAPFLPGRDRSSIMFDESDNVYLIGGEVRISDYLMTSSAFMSPDQGITWQPLPSTPWSARGSGIFLTHKSSKLDGREILTYFTGWDGRTNGLYNEVWVSSDNAQTWVRVRANWNEGLPPFRARDAANAEITESGVMILLGGQAEENGVRETLNDVWVSMDGGFSWGQCAEDATFEDRREPLTMLDDEGYLYVAGGWDSGIGRTFNDVWRSSFSFNNLTAVALACGLRVPACGPGLVCWPQDSKTTFYSNGTVTCPASRECAGVAGGYLDFDVQTLAAPYKPRWAANAEFFPKPISYLDLGGTRRTAAAGALVVSGGTGDAVNNDVWISQDGGITWALVAGYASRATDPGGLSRAWYPQSESSFFPARSEAVGIVDERHGFIYKIGGYGGGISESNDVWRTSDAINWYRMPAVGLTNLSSSSIVIDSKGKIYVAGGVRNGVTQSTFLVSTNNASSFYQQTPVVPPFLANNGRAKGFLLHHFSPRLNRDILTYGAGWNTSTLHNDIWSSSDDGITWARVSAAAPFLARDSAGAEITSSGLIVLAGGQAGPWTYNDVWVSPDGGYTWSVCSEETFWPDRRDLSTAMDREGYFYVINGRASTNTGARTYNDVYRSSFSFNDNVKVRAACNINIPACGVGLTCWPTAADTVVSATGVTCNAIRACQAAGPRSSSSSSTAIRRSSSSSTARRILPPTDPCDDDPEWDEDCWNYPWKSSTGGAKVKPTGLSSWAIGGIIFIVVAVVGGALLFAYKRWKGQQPQPALAAHRGATSSMTGENLLGEGETSTAHYTRA